MMRQGLQNIPVFYSEHMLADTDSFSPSASKPLHVLAAWHKAGLPIAVHPFAPASERPWIEAAVLGASDPRGTTELVMARNRA